MIEEGLEAGLEEIKNQLGTGHKNPEAVSSLIDKINQLESSIKSSLKEVKFGIPEGDTRTLPDTIANFISPKFKIEVTVADITSDFNIDLLDFESTKAKYVTDLIEGFGMKQLVKQPTRITENSATLIDYIVFSNEEIVSDVGTIHAAEVSGHELVYCIVDVIVKQKQILSQLETLKV
nr:unnamed protein product [Callosobruchus analis]